MQKNSDIIPDFQLGEWLVKPSLNQLVNQNESRRLDHKVMRLLLFFTQHQGRELSKDEIIQGVWGEGVHTEEVLTVAVSALRKGLGDNPKVPKFIKTVPRYGYLMLAHALPAAPSGETNSEETINSTSFKNTWQALEERVGLRFLILASLAGMILLIILVQVCVEIIYLIVQ